MAHHFEADTLAVRKIDFIHRDFDDTAPKVRCALFYAHTVRVAVPACELNR
jgi:hypothetical protein